LQQKIPLATKAQRHKEEKSKAFLLSALVTLWLKSFFVKKNLFQLFSFPSLLRLQNFAPANKSDALKKTSDNKNIRYFTFAIQYSALTFLFKNYQCVTKD
jgi:hypothetical protein